MASTDDVFDTLLREERASKKHSILDAKKVHSAEKSIAAPANLLPSQRAYLAAKQEGRSASDLEQARKNEDASRAELRSLMSAPGNNECADCTATLPDLMSAWAVLPHGIFVCLDCAQVHRSLGTHISKVKGANLDLWLESELAVVRDTGGNALASKAYGQLGLTSKLAADAPQNAKCDAAQAKYAGLRRPDWNRAKADAEKGLHKQEFPRMTEQKQIAQLNERVTRLEEKVGISCAPAGTRCEADSYDTGDDMVEEDCDKAVDATEKRAYPASVKAHACKVDREEDFFAGFGL